MKKISGIFWILVLSCVVSSLTGQVIVRCPNNTFKKRCVPTEESGLDQVTITPCDCNDQRNVYVGRSLCYRQITLCTETLIFPEEITEFDFPYFDLDPLSISNLYDQSGKSLLFSLDPAGEIDPFGENEDVALILEIDQTTKCVTMDVWTPFGENGGLKVFHAFDEQTGRESTVVNVPKSDDCGLYRENCYRFKSDHAPMDIRSSGLPTNSTIKTPIAGSISSIKVVDIDITYDPIFELRTRLVDGGSGENVELFNLICPGDSQMNIGFADDGISDIACPPTDGMTYQPSESLSYLNFANLTDELSGWILTLVDKFPLNGGSDGTLNSWEIEICVQERVCGPYIESTDTPLQIGPLKGTSTTSIINISEVGKVTDVNLSNVDITYPWIEDLVVTLTSPSNTVDTIFNKSCGDADNIYIGFDDESYIDTLPCPPIDSFLSTSPAYPLSIFDGEDAQGDWVLTVIDNHDLDAGTLNSWTLEVCTSCPEEYSVANNNEIKGTTLRRFSSIQSQRRYDTEGFIDSKELIRSGGDIVVYSARDSINLLKTFTVDTSGILEIYLDGCSSN